MPNEGLEKTSGITPIQVNLDVPQVPGDNILPQNVIDEIIQNEALTKNVIPDTTNSDYYSSNRNPMTQPGFSGYGISIPTIYGGGVQIPYALGDKVAKAKRDMEWANMKTTPEWLKLADPVENEVFYDSQVRKYQELYNRIKEQLKLKGINTKWTSMVVQNIPEFKKYQNMFSDFKTANDAAFNAYTDLLKDSTGEDKNYVSDDAVKASNEYIAVRDKYIQNPYDMESMSKFYDVSKRLIGLTNINTTVKGYIDNIKDQTAVKLGIDRNSSADYDTLITYEVGNNFAKKDNGTLVLVDENGKRTNDVTKGHAVFDEEAFNNYFDNSVWPGFKRQQELGIGTYNEDQLRNIFRQRLAGMTEKIDVKTVGKTNYGAIKYTHDLSLQKQIDGLNVESNTVEDNPYTTIPEGTYMVGSKVVQSRTSNEKVPVIYTPAGNINVTTKIPFIYVNGKRVKTDDFDAEGQVLRFEKRNTDGENLSKEGNQINTAQIAVPASVYKRWQGGGELANIDLNIVNWDKTKKSGNTETDKINAVNLKEGDWVIVTTDAKNIGADYLKNLASESGNKNIALKSYQYLTENGYDLGVTNIEGYTMPKNAQVNVQQTTKKENPTTLIKKDEWGELTTK